MANTCFSTTFDRTRTNCRSRSTSASNSPAPQGAITPAVVGIGNDSVASLRVHAIDFPIDPSAAISGKCCYERQLLQKVEAESRRATTLFSTPSKIQRRYSVKVLFLAPGMKMEASLRQTYFTLHPAKNWLQQRWGRGLAALSLGRRAATKGWPARGDCAIRRRSRNATIPGRQIACPTSAATNLRRSAWPTLKRKQDGGTRRAASTSGGPRSATLNLYAS
ncbi:MAG: hypothetical protein ABIZ80_15470 [Bryobacteraceae bacterium]